MKIVAMVLLLCFSSLMYAQEQHCLHTIQTDGAAVTTHRPLVLVNNTELQSRNFLLYPISLTIDQRYFIPGLSNCEYTGNLTAEQIFLRGFDCAAALHFETISAALRLRSLDDRSETDDNLLAAKACTIFDLSAMYRFETFELFVVIENIFNEAWNQAQSETGSQLWGESPDIASELLLKAGSPRSFHFGIAYHY